MTQTIDYTDGLLDANESTRLFATYFFSQSLRELECQEFVHVNDSMNMADIYCMFIEILLYGLHVIYPAITIFDYQSDDDTIYHLLQKYFLKMGVYLFLTEYNDQDYFFEIIESSCNSDNWNLLNYEMIRNYNFNPNKTLLSDYKSIFRNRNNKIYVISFNNI